MNNNLIEQTNINKLVIKGHERINILEETFNKIENINVLNNLINEIYVNKGRKINLQ